MIQSKKSSENLTENINAFFRTRTNECYAFCSAMITGFIAHGFIFFNNITLHDNTYNFYMGGTYTSGRWMLAKLLRLTQVIYDAGYLHFPSPRFLGFISLLCIGLSAALIVNLLKIRKRVSGILLGAVMVSFPVVASLFGYMFTAGLYTFGVLLGISGVFLIARAQQKSGWKKWILFLTGILLQACSVGVYQAHIGIISSLTILLFIQSLDSREDTGLPSVLKEILYYVTETVGYMLVYYILTFYFLKRVGQTLSSYQGINDTTHLGLGGYLSRIPLAYKEFFCPSPDVSRYMYMGGVRIFYQMILLLLLVFILIRLRTVYKKRIFHALFFLIALTVFPLSVNIIYVMCDNNIYSLMMYGEIMIFVLLIYFCDTTVFKWDRILKFLTAAVLSAVIILYCRYSDICYLKADFVQKAGISYFNRMISRIESTEGYVAGMPVVYIGQVPDVDPTLFLYNEFDEIKVWPFILDTVINNYNWRNFMKSNCGFDPPSGDPSLFMENSRVRKMPVYPSQGSVAVIDGYVVVKLEESVPSP